jgi:hypothetical protein
MAAPLRSSEIGGQGCALGEHERRWLQITI